MHQSVKYYNFHSHLKQSGSANGEAMTAFVLISLAEASNKFKDLYPGEQQGVSLVINFIDAC